MNQPQKPLIRRRPVTGKVSESAVPDPLLRRLYETRGVENDASVDLDSLSTLPSYEGLFGVQTAAQILADAIAAQVHIRIIGDYDVDGCTSTVVMYEALVLMGAKNVSFAVPNRVKQGYGLSPGLADEAAEEGVRVLVTVDNGIAAHAGVARAKELGMDVVVTDHHLPGDTLPDADALVDPVLAHQDFPSKTLAGVGVAFFVMLALRAELRQRGHFESHPEPNMAPLLDVVALGTVADVVQLDYVNRLLVEQGMRRIRTGRMRPGIAALLEVAGRDPKRLVASDFGFALGPRINAAGRLEDMTVGIECLLSKDPAYAMQIAKHLDEVNKSRRELEQTMREQATVQVDAAMAKVGDGDLPAALCLYDEHWHEGVVGLVAGRIKERFHRPTVAFAPGEDGNLKGSCRSIPGVHIRDVLADIAAHRPQMLSKFGGHAMAAGLSIEHQYLDEFSGLFAEAVARRAQPGAFEPVLMTDGELYPDEISLDCADDIRLGGPWGQGFPEPLFDGVFEVVDARVVGDAHMKMTLRDPRGGDDISAIAFRYAEMGVPDDPMGQVVRIAYKMDANLFRGWETLQFIVEGYDLAIEGEVVEKAA